MGVRGDTQPERMGGGDDRPHLLVGEMRLRPRPCCDSTPPVAVNLTTSAPAGTPRGRAPRIPADRCRCCGPTGSRTLGPEAADVAMAADDRQSRARGKDARAGDPSSAVPRRSMWPTRGAEPTSRTVVKPALAVVRVFSTPRIMPHSSGSTASRQNRRSVAGKVDVGVDQAGQHGAVRWKGRSAAPPPRRIEAAGHALDAAVDDGDGRRAARRRAGSAIRRPAWMTRVSAADGPPAA